MALEGAAGDKGQQCEGDTNEITETSVSELL